MARKSTRAACRRCLRTTKHLTLAMRETSHSEDVQGYGPIQWSDRYEMLECAGCESVTLRHTHWFSEEPDVVVVLYPPAVSRRSPNWKHKLPSRISSLMDEIYNALHSDSRRLALMGARTVLDIVLSEKIGEAGGFDSKLAKLEESGFVGTQSLEYLKAALEAGHAASHRGFDPKKDQLAHVMDIIENMLQTIYVLDQSAMELRKATPRRGGANQNRPK
jgi:hypothetical protein